MTLEDRLVKVEVAIFAVFFIGELLGDSQGQDSVGILAHSLHVLLHVHDQLKPAHVLLLDRGRTTQVNRVQRGLPTRPRADIITRIKQHIGDLLLLLLFVRVLMATRVAKARRGCAVRVADLGVAAQGLICTTIRVEIVVVLVGSLVVVLEQINHDRLHDSHRAKKRNS